MTTKLPYIVLALIGIAFLVGYCNREPETVKPETTAEATRQRIQNSDSLAAEIFAQVAKEHQKQIEALYSDLATAEGKRKQAEQKALESANTYAKTPILSNCDAALKDCQYENETKGYSLAVQEKMIAEQDSFISVQAFEINRIIAVKDSMNAGWEAANKKLTNKPLKVYATAAFEQHPINNNAKLGGTVTYDRWLFGYQKGIIQNTHEVKAGFLLQFKK
jgi:hypothetical protein